MELLASVAIMLALSSLARELYRKPERRTASMLRSHAVHDCRTGLAFNLMDTSLSIPEINAVSLTHDNHLGEAVLAAAETVRARRPRILVTPPPGKSSPEGPVIRSMAAMRPVMMPVAPPPPSVWENGA